MGVFSNLFEGIQNRVKENAQKKKEEQEFIRRMQLQAEVERKQIYEQEFIKNARLVSIAKAKKDAAEKSGLQKLRAMERVKRLQDGSIAPGSFFDKLAQYTQKNMAKKEENMKKTQELRKAAKEMRDKKLSEQQRFRSTRMSGTGRTGWQ